MPGAQSSQTCCWRQGSLTSQGPELYTRQCARACKLGTTQGSVPTSRVRGLASTAGLLEGRERTPVSNFGVGA